MHKIEFKNHAAFKIKVKPRQTLNIKLLEQQQQQQHYNTNNNKTQRSIVEFNDTTHLFDDFNLNNENQLTNAIKISNDNEKAYFINSKNGFRPSNTKKINQLSQRSKLNDLNEDILRLEEFTQDMLENKFIKNEKSKLDSSQIGDLKLKAPRGRMSNETGNVVLNFDFFDLK